MLLEIMHDNFMKEGYQTMSIPPELRRGGKVFIEYVCVEGEAYVVTLLDYHKGMEWERWDYDALTRNVKSTFYNHGFGVVHYLHVFVTSNPERTGELGVYGEAYWVVDDQDLRLMIYEDQKSDFLNAKGIVEASLEGRSLQKSRVYPFPLVTALLFAANLLAFFWIEAFGSSLDVDFMLRHGAMNVERVIRYGEYYRFLTSMFLHFGLEHLFNNLISLGAYGYYMEGLLGKARFLLLYLVTGLVAGVASFAYHWLVEGNVVAAGASGAIFGLCGGLLCLLLKNRGRLRGLSVRHMAFFVGLSLYNGFASPGIDNAAHIAGFLCGLAVVGAMPIRKKIGGKG